jgi:hypothetical protein
MRRVSIDWQRYETEFAEGLICDEVLDLGAEAIVDRMDIDLSDEQLDRSADFIQRKTCRPSAGDCWPGVFRTTLRLRFMIFSQYPLAVWRTLEGRLRALGRVDYSPSKRIEVKRQRKRDYHAALEMAPGAKAAIEKSRDMSTRSDLLDWIGWLETQQIVVSPPPWRDNVVQWRRDIVGEFEIYRDRLLQRLDDCLATRQIQIHASLHMGLSDEVLAVGEKSLGFALPSPLRALYRWHDGMSASVSFFMNYRLLTLNEAIERKREIRGARVPGSPSSLFPLLSNAAGDLLCLDLAASTSSLLEVRRLDPEYCALFVDFEAWLEAFVQAIEQEMFEVTTSGFKLVTELLEARGHRVFGGIVVHCDERDVGARHRSAKKQKHPSPAC